MPACPQLFCNSAEMNGYRCFNFTEKLSYEMRTLSNQKMSNFHCDLSLKLSQGKVHDFSGEVQKFSGEVQNDLRGGAKRSQGRYAPPHTSPQNPVMAGTTSLTRNFLTVNTVYLTIVLQVLYLEMKECILYYS